MLIVEEHFRSGVLVYLWAKYFWRQMLEARQRNVLRTYRTVPIELKDVLQEEKYESYRVLALYRSGFEFFKDTINIGVATTLVVFKGFRTLWDKSGEIITYFGFSATHDILQNALFITMLNSCTFVVNLPFAAYEVYVMEGRIGIHRVTMSGALLGHVITQMILFPFVCLFVGLIKLGGDNIFLYMFYFAELQALLDVSNLDILDPLPVCALRNELQTFLEQLEFPLYDIYVVQYPIFKRHHSQVYIYGTPGQKVIVLYGSIASKHYAADAREEVVTIDEIIALVAHEMGHWKYSHNYIYFFVNQIYLCVHLFSLHWLMNYEPMYRAFGFDNKPYAVGFVLIQSYPISDMCSFLIRLVNRRLELCADRYVKKLKKDRALKTAIAKIGEQTTEFPIQDWLYSYCHNTQPSCYERIIALDKYNT